MISDGRLQGFWDSFILEPTGEHRHENMSICDSCATQNHYLYASEREGTVSLPRQRLTLS